MIRDLAKRLDKLESAIAARIVRDDPRQRLVVACQLAAMRASMSPTRGELERVERFQRAVNTGDTTKLTKGERRFSETLSFSCFNGKET